MPKLLGKFWREIIPTYDTAGSVKMLKEKALKNAAAIASEKAADLYDMQILAKDIADNPENYTRFFVLSTEDAAPTGKDKTIHHLLRKTRTRLTIQRHRGIRKTKHQLNQNRIATNQKRRGNTTFTLTLRGTEPRNGALKH